MYEVQVSDPRYVHPRYGFSTAPTKKEALANFEKGFTHVKVINIRRIPRGQEERTRWRRYREQRHERSS